MARPFFAFEEAGPSRARKTSFEVGARCPRWLYPNCVVSHMLPVTFFPLRGKRMNNRMSRRDVNLGLLTMAGAALLGPAAAQSPPSLRVNSTRLSSHLSALSEFAKNPKGGVSRVAYSEAAGTCIHV
jgi:hypothetical protein